MIARRPRWRRPAAAATLLAWLCAGAFALQGSKEEHWKKVIDLDQAGAELVRRETQAPSELRDGIRRQRIEVHRQARAELARYIRAWLPEWQRLAYLQAIFRSALYAELSEEWMLALQDYSFCLRHPELGNPEATWKATALPGLVEQGWTAVVANVRPSADMTGTWTTRSYLHQKGIQPEVFAMQGQAGHAALDPDQALEVASRMRPERDLAAAGALGSALLAQAQLDHQAVEQEGLAVLGVGASHDVVRQFASRLVEAKAWLRGRYFDAALEPPALVVYANLLEADFAGQEALGERLSQAIHFRTKTMLEGYFEPLDHSIVLRRGLRPEPSDPEPRPQFYLGTPYHELTHALINQEFPAAPIWLDEGLAALHEAYALERGPLDNYRLYFARAALDGGKLPPIERLVDPDVPGWQDRNAIVLIAAARYFCFYLEVRSPGGSQLREVYRRMRDGHNEGREIDAMVVLQDVTGLGPSALNGEFRGFLASRDPDALPASWRNHRFEYEHVVQEYVWPKW